MICDHIAVVLYNENTIEYNILKNCIGRISFPIFCVLITEGFLYSKHHIKKIILLLVCGIISEIPFDLATEGHINITHQNVMLSWALCYICLYFIDKIIKSNNNKLDKSCFCIGITLIFTVIAYYTNVDYLYCVILVPVITYFLFYIKVLSHKMILILSAMLASAVIIFTYDTLAALLCIPFFILYNYEKKSDKTFKYLFYIIYPLHLVILWIISIGGINAFICR